jgi:hypothetical protein
MHVWGSRHVVGGVDRVRMRGWGLEHVIGGVRTHGWSQKTPPSHALSEGGVWW